MGAKYDRIGINYNSTRRADDYISRQFFKYLKPVDSGQYADIGCGTGNYTIVLHNLGLDFVGIEPSAVMLEEARSKTNKINWIKGVAEAIPLENESKDGVTAMLTIHHWTDLGQGFSEIHRILKPGRPFVLFTSTFEQTSAYWLRHYFPEIMHEAAVLMPDEKTIESTLVNSQFTIDEKIPYFIRDDQADLFLYSGKNRPELYFDQRVRNGISSFADVNRNEEVKSGLSLLKSHIESGHIHQVIKNAHHDGGDYVFYVARKY